MNAATRLAVAVLFSLFAAVAQAAKPLPYGATAAEIVLLPDFCQARLGGMNTELYRRWNERMGPDKFVHLHHYCHGLRFMSRYRAAVDDQLRRGYLQAAAGEFNYVLQRWPDGFALKADAKARKAEAEAALRRLTP